MLEVLYHRAEFGGSRIPSAAGVAKNVEFFVCLSVYLFVTLLNVTVCAHDFATKGLEYRNGFDVVEQGKVRTVVYPSSTFSDCCQLATSLNAKVQKQFFFRRLKTTE